MDAIGSKYKIEKYGFNELDRTVVLPSFQRKLVWSKTEKKNFIETLHNGYPFGAILVYQYPNEDKISLIDGLQRFTTIRDYRDNPQEYIPINEFIERTLNLFVTENTPATTTANCKAVIERVFKKYINDLDKYTQSLDLFNLLEEELLSSFPQISDHLREIIQIKDDLTKSITNYLDIRRIDIPTIVFTGSDTELAIVFENLNRGGKKLSKYQVFAAQWYKYDVKLSDEKYNKRLLEKTINWYEMLENERGIEIENFEPDTMREKSEINIAELCFAFGQMILEKTPVFWEGSGSDTANEIGYSSMAIIFGVKNKELSTIIAEENRALFSKSDLIEEILEAALVIYKDINMLFQQYLHTPGNLSNFKYALGTNFQILSYFAALWNIRYELNKERLTLQSRKGSSKEYECVKKNLLKWYLYDIVESNWSGSGDTKLDQIAIDHNNKYLNEILSENLNNALMKWYDEQLQKRSINFEPIAKMLYTVNASFDSNAYTSSKYDLEHVISRKLIAKTPNRAVISGGTLGNLMFLDQITNRGKKEQFMYQYVDDDAFEVKQSFIDLHFYPSKKNLQSIKREIEAKGSDYSNTQSVIKNRGSEIINSLVKNLE
ncbi:DUF262 domain-containing protein [Enterococcus sp. LJL51]|uniref:DUF262 domain-containing protein n=1 Tax=Enterococcus sp. LJL51 TaxID=3416656 RepID=UPI003CEF3D34